LIDASPSIENGCNIPPSKGAQKKSLAFCRAFSLSIGELG